VPQEQLVRELKQRNAIRPQTFKEAQARELVILPPSFTEKNLQTKKVAEDRNIQVGRQKQASEKAVTTTESNKRIKKRGGFGIEPARAEQSGGQSVGSSDKNTIDSARQESEQREELMHHSQSQASAQV